MKTLLMLGVSLLAASVAQAQATATKTSSGIPDTVTTATKVETKLQKNPQTVTTVQGAVLQREGVTALSGLSKLVSGLQIDQVGASTSIYIRGVGTRVLGGNTDPAVAFSVDGVYYAGTIGLDATLFDTARVEVVKGPQGTLYGRNATGGAVNVVSNRPVLGARTLDGLIEFGNYASQRTMVAVNLPIGADAAIRISGQSLYHKGYLSDGYDDEDTKSARASLLYKPHDGFSLFVSADYAHQGGMGTAAVPIGPGPAGSALTTRFAVPGDPYTGPSDPRVNAFLHAAAPASAFQLPLPGTYYCPALVLTPVADASNPVGAGAYTGCAYPLGVQDIKPDGYLNNDIFGANVTLDADVGIGDLTAIGGYRGTRQDTKLYPYPEVYTFGATLNQFSGELRLSSKPNGSPLKWLVGAFYMREQQRVSVRSSSNGINIPNPFAVPDSPVPVTACAVPIVPGFCLANAVALQGLDVEVPSIVNETKAGFAQATYAVRPWLRLTGGIRYTQEGKTEKGGVVTEFYLLPAGLTTTFPSYGAVKFHNISYRAGMDADLTANSLLFATYSTAFHAGGYNLGVEPGPNTYSFQPEKVTSYAAGLKNRFFNNRVQFNVEAFWLNYQNYQHLSISRVNDGSTGCSGAGNELACPLFQRVDNARSARIRGVEVGLVYAPTATTLLNVNTLVNDARFRDFSVVSLLGATTDYRGHRLPGTTPVTVTGGVNQTIPLGNGGRLIADVRTQYKAGAYLWYDYTPGNYQKAYTRTDLSLAYEAPNARFTVTGFVRNVENKATIAEGATPNATTNVVWTNLNAPRTFGGMLGFKF